MSPTFWLNTYDNDGNMQNSVDESEMENLLRKIMETGKCSFNFDIFNEEFSNFTKPHINIDIKIQDTKAQFSPENWWHLIFVLQSILFATGEKSAEKLLIDRLREEELKEFKVEHLSELIQSKLQSMVTYFDVKNRPMIDKKITWEITTGYMEFYDNNKMFSSIDLKNFTGFFLVYNNKETKCDIDIQKVMIQNHLDHPDYLWALFPGYSQQNPRTLDHMLKFRIRDKFVIVKKAPWKVFDQFEIFLDSMTVKLTKKFYSKFQRFMLFKEEQKKIDALQSMQDEKKIDLLMPSRDSTILEYSLDDVEENKTNILKAVSEESKSGSSSIRYHDSFSDEFNSDEGSNAMRSLETTTKNYNKMQVKTVPSSDKLLSSFRFNKIGQKLTSPFKTMRNIKPKADNGNFVRHPVFFRYFRINEIGVALTYKHSDSSMLNTKNLRITIKPFIKHCKFVNFQKMLSKYEHFLKRSLVIQLPSIIKQKLLKITLSKDEDDDDVYDGIDREEAKSLKARQILFGKYADQLVRIKGK